VERKRFDKEAGYSSIPRWQHPLRIEDPKWHRSGSSSGECEWKQGESALAEKKKGLRQQGI
jgi:hypothetical protein